MYSLRSVATLLMLFSLCAATGQAQTASGALVSGAVGVALVDSRSDINVTASAGYRFNRAFGLGVELTMMPSLPRNLPDYYPLVRIDNADGSITAFTTNVRLEIPTTPARIVPYVVMGGGVANIKESADVIIAGFPGIDPTIFGLPPEALSLIFPPSPDIRSPFTVSTTDLALTVGGGVSVLATHGMSIDVDLRYLHLMGTEDRSIGRFGAGVSYRF
jgi:opacity protein-like surface antigen